LASFRDVENNIASDFDLEVLDPRCIFHLGELDLQAVPFCILASFRDVENNIASDFDLEVLDPRCIFSPNIEK
jgi:hypothetical protein